jgi:hypothetical protein
MKRCNGPNHRRSSRSTCAVAGRESRLAKRRPCGARIVATKAAMADGRSGVDARSSKPIRLSGGDSGWIVGVTS